MLSDFLIRLRALFWRNAVENELNDELSLRPPVRAIHSVRVACPRSASPRARLIFGGSEQIKEECRDARSPLSGRQFLLGLPVVNGQIGRRPGAC